MKFLLNSSGNGIAAPIDASYYKGKGLRQGIEREFIVMEVDNEQNDLLDKAKPLRTETDRRCECFEEP